MLRTCTIALPRSITLVKSNSIAATSKLVKPRYFTNSFKQSHTMSERGPSKACCSIPAVVSEGYKEKGKYETIAGLKAYVTGNPKATKAILYIFDIFGYFPQTIQGADILASQAAPNDYLVVIPDFFDGPAADISWFPPQNDDHKAKLGKFFSTKGDGKAALGRVPTIVKSFEEKYPSVKDWGVAGFCWGGKLVSFLAGQENGSFKVAAEAHPAFLDPKDAESIKIPIAILASKDEDAEDVKKFGETLKVDNYIETFGDQIHGWMGARSDLADEKVKKEYERGFATLLDFFAKHL